MGSSATVYFAAFASLGLTACSPYAFRAPALGIGNSLSAISDARREAATQLQADWIATRRVSFLLSRPILRASDGCDGLPKLAGEPTPPACRLLQAVADRQQPPGLDVPPILPRFSSVNDPPLAAAHVMPPCNIPIHDGRWVGFGAGAKPPGVIGLASPSFAMARYAEALKAITDSADREAYDAASARLVEGLSRIGAYAGPYGALVGPVGSAVTWLIGQELDWQRRRALERAVANACLPVRTLAAAVGVELAAMKRVRLGRLGDLLRAQLRALNGDPIRRRADDREYGARYDQAEETAARIRALDSTDPAALATALSESHDDLVTAVQSGKGDLESLATSLSRLAALTSELQAALGEARSRARAASGNASGE